MIKFERISYEPLVFNIYNILTFKVINPTQNPLLKLRITLKSEIFEEDIVKIIDVLEPGKEVLEQFKIKPVILTSLGIINITLKINEQVNKKFQEKVTVIGNENKNVTVNNGNYIRGNVDKFADERVDVAPGAQYIGEDTIIQRTNLSTDIKPQQKLSSDGNFEKKTVLPVEKKIQIPLISPKKKNKFLETSLLFLDSNDEVKLCLLNKSIIRGGRSRICPYSGSKNDMLFRTKNEKKNLKISRGHCIIKFEGSNYYYYDSNKLFKEQRSRTKYNNEQIEKICINKNLSLILNETFELDIKYLSDSNISLLKDKYVTFIDEIYLKLVDREKLFVVEKKADCDMIISYDNKNFIIINNSIDDLKLNNNLMKIDNTATISNLDKIKIQDELISVLLIV